MRGSLAVALWTLSCIAHLIIHSRSFSFQIGFLFFWARARHANTRIKTVQPYIGEQVPGMAIMQEDLFREQVRSIWAALRASAFSDTAVAAILNGNAGAMAAAAERTYGRWGAVARPLSNTDWEPEVALLRSWVADRLAWMDEVL